MTVPTGEAAATMGQLEERVVEVRRHTLGNFAPNDGAPGSQFLFEDPDGNLVETYSIEADDDGSWNVFTSPHANAGGDVQPRGRNVPAGVVHLSHWSLGVADPERSLPFYREVMGWTQVAVIEWAGEGPSRVMDVGPARLTTWLLTRDEQRIEIIHFEQPQMVRRARPAANELGLSHMTVEVDDVGATIRELEARGVVVRSDSRKLDGEGGEQFVFEDPDGNIIRATTRQEWR